MNEVYPTSSARYSKSSKLFTFYIQLDGYIAISAVEMFIGSMMTIQGLLVILEYATRMTDRGRHNVRTGTPFFTAAETPVRRYLFTPGNRKLKDNSHKKIDFDLVKKSVSKTRVAVPIVPFAHSPLHDLESVWWIIMTMHELFHGRLDVNDREVFLRDFNRLPDAQSYLSPSFGPALEILTELAEVLTTAYINLEKKYPAGIDTQYFMVHNDFLDPLLSEEYMDSLGDITLVQVTENGQLLVNTCVSILNLYMLSSIISYPLGHPCRRAWMGTNVVVAAVDLHGSSHPRNTALSS
ncbi:hypothetical protein F5050DRAFT_1838139 [Lentinula boryana]|uniref:Uncharacterized protein n=1 Tax=Lentinula boryana TaxID=40481 RepID=A0ABQ8Q781_9AGAR|nr:hypothetical protein F5050DRAFT_1838139 [Lentinula boryana]